MLYILIPIYLCSLSRCMYSSLALGVGFSTTHCMLFCRRQITVAVRCSSLLRINNFKSDKLLLLRWYSPPDIFIFLYYLSNNQRFLFDCILHNDSMLDNICYILHTFTWYIHHSNGSILTLLAVYYINSHGMYIYFPCLRLYITYFYMGYTSLCVRETCWATTSCCIFHTFT